MEYRSGDFKYIKTIMTVKALTITKSKLPPLRERKSLDKLRFSKKSKSDQFHLSNLIHQQLMMVIKMEIKMATKMMVLETKLVMTKILQMPLIKVVILHLMLLTKAPVSLAGLLMGLASRGLSREDR